VGRTCCRPFFEGCSRTHQSSSSSSSSAAAEAPKKWNGECVPRGRGLGRGLAPSLVMRVQGCHFRKTFENIGAGLCNLVHFWQPVQQKMYNSVFNLDLLQTV